MRNHSFTQDLTLPMREKIPPTSGFSLRPVGSVIFLVALLVNSGCSRLFGPRHTDPQPVLDVLQGTTRNDYDTIDISPMNYSKEMAVTINGELLNFYEYSQTNAPGVHTLTFKQKVRLNPNGTITIFQGTPAAPTGSVYAIQTL